MAKDNGDDLDLAPEHEEDSPDGGSVKKKSSKLIRILQTTKGVVGSLVAIAGGIAALYTYFSGAFDTIIPASEPQPVASPMSCFKSNHLTPNLIPHYLLNSVGSKEFPYWIKFVGKNECTKALLLNVSFREGQNILLKPDPQLQRLTLDPETRFEKVLKPNFDLGTLTALRVIMSWSITDEEGTIFKQGMIETEIVPPNMIAWDLQKPKEPAGTEPVGKEYLMASFAAWTEKPSRLVAEVADKCRGSGRAMLVGEDAIRACHDRLFRGARQVAIIGQPIKFPGDTRQSISPPAQAIKERSATSLEAALLLAGVSAAGHKSGIDTDLIMLVVPADAQGSAQKKTVLLAWKSEDDTWRAIDMRVAGTTAFGANAARTSERVNRLFGENTQIREALEQRGAYFDSTTGVAGVNFRQAPIVNGIQPALNI